MPLAARKPALLSKEQRQAIERELSVPYLCSVKLKIDGHEITLRTERFKGLRFVVSLYVDGHIKGEDLKVESAIGAKFYPLKTFGPSRKELASYAKAMGKREAARWDKRCREKCAIRLPYFSSAKACLAHLQRTCDGIEVVHCGLTRADLALSKEGLAHA
jgi:hypothetical protein